jgi:hypothetical protein
MSNNREYQIITVSSDNILLHAGVHKLGRISHRTIQKLERKWQIWRKEYIANHPGQYPLSSDAYKLPKYVTYFPVDNPNSKSLVEVK